MDPKYSKGGRHHYYAFIYAETRLIESSFYDSMSFKPVKKLYTNLNITIFCDGFCYVKGNENQDVSVSSWLCKFLQ
jgi:hypothetical protein